MLLWISGLAAAKEGVGSGEILSDLDNSLFKWKYVNAYCSGIGKHLQLLVVHNRFKKSVYSKPEPRGTHTNRCIRTRTRTMTRTTNIYTRKIGFIGLSSL